MKRLLGGIMIAAGILIAGASGLCSLVFVISMLGSPGSGGLGGVFGLLLLVAIFGGAPFGVGMGLFVFGRRLIRSDDPPSDHRGVF